MKAIRFLTDYRGQWTGEAYYKAGHQIEIEDHAAEQLVNAGRAENVDQTLPQLSHNQLRKLRIAELATMAYERGLVGLDANKTKAEYIALLDN